MDIIRNKIGILFFLFVALNIKFMHMPSSEDDFYTHYKNLYDMDIEKIDYPKAYLQGKNELNQNEKKDETKIIIRQIKNIFKKSTK